MSNYISNVLNKNVKGMEHAYNGTEMVGNRPHFPVVVMHNCESESILPLKNKIKRSWPQSNEYILYSMYSFDDDGSCNMYNSDNSLLDVDSFRCWLDSTKRSGDVFAEMSLWCFYNIIDTEGMKTLEDFKRSYKMLEKFKHIAVDKVRSLAIVLLDDRLTSRDLSKEIKKYIFETVNSQNLSEKYDGNLVIANRDISDITYEKNALITLASNAILVSNNDAVGSYDDENFRNIVLRLYGNNINTVSYAVEHRPNRDIALQIYSVIIAEIKKLISKDMYDQDFNWQKRLGIYAGKISCIDEYLKKRTLTLDLSSLDYLPLKVVDNDTEKMADMKYSKFIAQSWETTLTDFIQTNLYSNEEITSIVKECVDRFESFMVDNVAANELNYLTLKEIDELFSEIQCVEPNQNSTLGEYINALFIFNLQKNGVLPEVKKKIIDLQKQSSELKNVIVALSNEFYSCLPTNGIEYLGNLYKNMAENYLNTDFGKKHMKVILSPKTTIEQIADEISKMCDEIVDTNRNVFSLSFIKEWEKRLDSAEGSVYKILNSKIDNQLSRHVYLNGNFPTTDGVIVYMFRTHKNSNFTQEKTDLFNYFQSEFSETSDVQFLNTGSDDLLEVMKFISLPYQNILM